MSSNKAPVNDAIIVAVAQLVNDAQSGTREPSHSDLEFQIKSRRTQRRRSENAGPHGR